MTRNPRRSILIAFLAALLGVCVWSGESFASDPCVLDPNTSVMRCVYDYGDTAFTPTGGHPVEVRASVYAPSDLPGGPYPLILFVHGRHAYCDGLEIPISTWPCPPANPPVRNYTGYDYIGEILASHGYIVVSISANGVMWNEGVDGPQRRAELIQEHLDRWAVFNTTVESKLNGLFVGKVDLTRVGTMGHSRGGDGVVQHFVLNQMQGSPYGVRAVMPLAATAFTNALVDDAALAVGLPYCDGSVKELPGVSFFDRARYDPLTQQGPRHTLLFMGAGHSDFNTIWSQSNNPNQVTCPTIPANTPEEQRAALVTYLSAFFRFYVGGESEFGPLLTGDAPVPPSALPAEVHVGYHPSADQRLDVNPLEDVDDLTTNALGGAVTQSELAAGTYELCGASESCLEDGEWWQEPHQWTYPGVGMLRLFWDGQASFTNELAPSGAPRNVSGYRTLQFRASVSFEDPRNPVDQPQDFRVALADGSGGEASVRVGDHSDALFFPPGLLDPEPAHPLVPRLLLNTARIPLSAFAGVDLTAVESIRFDFEGSGAVFVSDLAFADCDDGDGDGICDFLDNCLAVANGPTAGPNNQCDTDTDGYGNVCDGDFNQDGVVGGADLNPIFIDDYQAGTDSGVGTDMNCDGVVDGADFSPYFLTAFQSGSVGASGLACADPTGATAPCVAIASAGDTDADGVANFQDNCVIVPNGAAQAPNDQSCDVDLDGFGNACDGDFDQDGDVDATDFDPIFIDDYQSGTDSGVGTDMNCDGVVDGNDLSGYFLPQLSLGSPGPAGSP